MRRRSGRDGRTIFGMPVIPPGGPGDHHKVLCYHDDADGPRWELGSLHGDLHGPHTHVEVTGLHGKPLQAPGGAGDNGKLIGYDHAGGQYRLVSVEAATGGDPSVGGDLTGTAGAATVAKLQGRPVPASGGSGLYLRLNQAGTAYEHGALPAPEPAPTSLSVGGDLSGATNNATVTRLQGKGLPIPAAADDGKQLAYNHAANAYQLVAPASGGETAVADLCVSVTGAAAAGVTATLPAAVGQTHRISLIQIERYATAAITGTATPIVVTSTNLPGNLAWTFARAAAVGTLESKVLPFNPPLQASAANTNTTIVCPGTASVIWRVNVHYTLG